VTEARIEATHGTGVIDGRLFVPEGERRGAGAPLPLVVMYMDAYGLRPTLSAMAERLTALGYAVLQPNLYWRAGAFAPFDPASAFQDPKERERITALIRGVRPEEAMADTRALVDAAGAADAGIRTDRIGVVGYCMGGRVAFIAAARIPERVVAAACIHPGGLVTDAPDSPHRAVSDIRGEVYIAGADQDQGFTPAHRETLRGALDAAGVTYDLELYAGSRHGFAVPDHTVYDEVAAERQWQRVSALFDRTLRRG